MDIKPGADGLYAVCFRNFDGRNREEITEKFNKFGQVISVRFSGHDETGMVFVRYKEYEETKKCLDEFRKTKELNVRMAMNKSETAAFQSGSSPRSDNSNYRSKPQSDTKKLNQQNFYSDGKNRYSNPVNGQKMSDEADEMRPVNGVSYKTEFQNQYQVTENSGNNHKAHYSNGDSSSIRPKKNHPKRSSECEDEGSKGIDNKSKKFYKELETRSPKANNSNGNESDGPPPPLADSNEIPPLENMTEIPDLVDAQPMMKAVDVLLANIPRRIEEKHILGLMKDICVNPVHISPVELTGIKYNIPYCHVWLENRYDAELVETELSRLYLDGKKLVAVRAQILLRDEVET